MLSRIIISGFGGQGVMKIGEIIGQGAFEQGIKSTVLPTYGIEQRGGTANTTVVVSDREISAPVADHPDVVCALNQPSVNKYLSLVKKGGCLIVNSSQVDTPITREDIQVIEVPADEIALKLGSIKVSNIVVMGAYIGYAKTLSLDVLRTTMNKKFSIKQEFAEMNSKALEIGYSIGSGEVAS